MVCANREDGFDDLEDEVLLSLGDHAGAVLDNARLHDELRGNHLAVVGLVADAVAARDATLGGHAEQVSAYVATVAERLGVEDDRREPLIFASLLHDVGKLGISERILAKPTALTPEERTIVELHPRLGYRLLSRIPALEPVAEAVLHHHERWDGMGYPACLQGESIPLEARIIAVADAFSAMVAGRPYARRRALEDACRELEACAGSQFDPVVVNVFVAEVRSRPLDVKRAGRLADALGDPELAVLAAGEPMLGRGTFALIDSLTLLYSHRYLHERATAAEYRAALDGRPFAVIVLELRALPAINARDGYGRGDELLLEAARAAQRAAVRSGGTACRHGGARLALIVPDVELAAAGFVAEGLLADVPGAADPRVGLAVWEPRDTGAEVVQRALAAVRTSPVRPPAGPAAPVVRLPAARTLLRVERRARRASRRRRRPRYAVARRTATASGRPSTATVSPAPSPS